MEAGLASASVPWCILCLLLLAGCRSGARPISARAAGDVWAGLSGDDRRRFGAGMPREAGAIGDYAVEQVRTVPAVGYERIGEAQFPEPLHAPEGLLGRSLVLLVRR